MTFRKTIPIVLSAVLTTSALAEDNWIKRSAVLHADPSPAGDTVSKVERGDKVQVLEKNGSWVRVDFKGKTGWVAADSLSSREVKAEVKLSGPLGTSAESSTGAAAKGLQPITSDYAQRRGLSVAGVKEMENIKKSVTPQMLKDFVAEGNIEAPRRRGRRGTAAPATPETSAPAPAQPRVSDQY